MWSNTLKIEEVESTKRAISALKKVPWAQPVLKRLKQAGDFKSENMPLMFEVRYTYELYRAGKVAEYEYGTGIGNSTVEFKISGDTTWLVELVSLRTSNAAKKATVQNGPFIEQKFSSDAEDNKQTEEAEMITAQGKIGEKVFTKGAATKFPPPGNNIYHVILADMRGYLDEGGDRDDYREMAYGASGLSGNEPWKIHSLKNKHGKREPIKGLFEKACPIDASEYIRKRIHFLGFICERDFCENEIPKKAYYLPNPHLISNEEAMELYKSFPLINHTIAPEM